MNLIPKMESSEFHGSETSALAHLGEQASLQACLRCWNTDDNLKHNPHLTRNHIISALPPKFPSYLYSWKRFLSNLWSYFPLDLLISFPHCLDYYFSKYLAWSFHFLKPGVFGDVSQRYSTCLAFTTSNGIFFSCYRANLTCHLFHSLNFLSLAH